MFQLAHGAKPENLRFLLLDVKANAAADVIMPIPPTARDVVGLLFPQPDADYWTATPMLIAGGPASASPFNTSIPGASALGSAFNALVQNGVFLRLGSLNGIEFRNRRYIAEKTAVTVFYLDP